MRNLKKFLALVLAMMMVFSLMVTVNAASYADVTDSNKYIEAIKVLSGIKVFTGYEDGTFHPDREITRGEVAAVIYRAVTGDVENKNVNNYKDYNFFKDVKSTDWFAPYVNFCHIHELVKGRGDGRFDPYAYVTGHEVLAMILRGVGYGQRHEFEGSNWRINVASRAQLLGITATTGEILLGEYANRDVVAELIFRTITRVPQVTYTPALDYNDKRDTLVQGSTIVYNPDLAWQVFGLTNYGPGYSTDKWGAEPSYVTWYTVREARHTGANLYTEPSATYVADGVNEIVETPLEKVLDEHKPITECDVADALGLRDQDDPVTIAAGFIDGNRVPLSRTISEAVNGTITSDDELPNLIEPMDVENYIGAQGRWTRVYKTADGNPWIAEVNVWLAKVMDVEEQSDPDDNGHYSHRVITLEVYKSVTAPGDTMDTSNTIKLSTYDDEGTYHLGDYLLVYLCETDTAAGVPVYRTFEHDERDLDIDANITNPNPLRGNLSSEIVSRAQVLAVGSLEDYEDGERPAPDTTTVGDKDPLKDSDKYYLNHRDESRVYTVLGDGHGNVIGLGTSSNWAVIESITFIHVGLRGNYAVADLMTLDGTRIPDARIAYINGEKANNVNDDVPDEDDVLAGQVSDDPENNTAYYGHLFSWAYDEETDTYSINSHEEYGKPADGPEFYDVKNGSVVSGQGQVWDSDGTTVVAMGTTDTIYLVKQDDGTYKHYTNKNVPNISRADICVMMDEDGEYASVVVIDGTSANNTFVALVLTGSAASGSSKLGERHQVWKLGEKSPTTVYDDGLGDAWSSGRWDGTNLDDTKSATHGWFCVDTTTQSGGKKIMAAGNSGAALTDTNIIYKAPGLYEFTVTEKGVIVEMTKIAIGLVGDVNNDGTPDAGTNAGAALATAKNDAQTQIYGLFQVATDLKKGSFTAYKIDSGDLAADTSAEVNFNMDNGYTLLALDNYTTPTKVQGGIKDKHIVKDLIVLVAYTEVGTKNPQNKVQAVYIIGEAAGAPVTPPGGGSTTGTGAAPTVAGTADAYGNVTVTAADDSDPLAVRTAVLAALEAAGYTDVTVTNKSSVTNAWDAYDYTAKKGTTTLPIAVTFNMYYKVTVTTVAGSTGATVTSTTPNALYLNENGKDASGKNVFTIDVVGTTMPTDDSKTPTAAFSSGPDNTLTAAYASCEATKNVITLTVGTKTTTGISAGKTITITLVK